MRTLLIGLLLTLVSVDASAQVLVRTTQPITYAPLPAPTIITMDVDDGQTNVTVPFPIQYYSNSYTQLTIGNNGAVAFPQGLSIFLTNEAPGLTTGLNNFIAPFWDDLRLFSANTGYIGHQVQGTAPNRTFTVEWRNISRFGASGVVFSMKLRFFESQLRYEIDYGPMTGTAVFSSSMGMEDATGANPIFFSANACVTNCAQTDYTALANRRVIIAQPIRPEMTGSFGTFPRGAFPGMQAIGNLVLRNLATNTATSIVTDVYLSLDDVLDPLTDSFAGTVTTPSLPSGDTTVPVTITVPPGAANADYYLLARIDAPDDWIEINEADNDFDGPRFATAYEIQPTAISTAQSGINPGQTAIFDVQITNNGVPRIGPLDLAIYASVDNIFDAGDTMMFVSTVNLTGLNVEMAQASGPLSNLSPAQYFSIAVADPNNQIAETNDANNTVVSVAPFQSGPDFGVTSVVIPVSVAPGANAAITTTLSSLATPFTGAVTYRLWASTDQMLGNDTQLGTFTVNFTGQASLVDAQTVAFPANLPPEAWYVLAQVDSAGAIAEVSEMNNLGASATTLLNGPDFRVTLADVAPDIVQVGDAITVNATLNSSGVPFTGNVAYGIYVSPNNMFDPGDVQIQSGTVFVGGLSTAGISTMFNLPSVVPGVYTVFVVADPGDALAEAIETNNFGPAAGTFTVQGADLRVNDMTGDPVAFIGRTYQVTLTLENTGVAEARGFQYAYYFSEDEAIRIFDMQIYVSQTATIAAGGRQTFIDTITIPTLSSTTSLYLGVLVDIYTQVPETNPNNNIGRIPVPLRIVFPIPDLTAQIVETSTVGAAGEQFVVTRQLLNIGVAAAGAFEYAYYLSTNPVISTDDFEIGRFPLTLGEGEDDYAIDVLTLPSDIPATNYFVGVIVDPDELIDEVTEENNAITGPVVPIFSAAIQFVTDRLPNATTGVPYEIGIYAQGGPLPIGWSVQSGVLPDGLTLSSSSGIIAGLPTTEGLFEFVLRGSSGTAYSDKPFSIRVTAPTVELEIATPSLPSAIAGRAYTATLIAVGGNPPYVWEAISELPAGLTFTEEGLLSGAPTTPGNLPITVSVRDSLNNSDSRALVLAVLNANQSVQITQVPLPKAVVGLPYCEPEMIVFEASNGVPPYHWSLIGDVPPGMTLSDAGAFCGTPEQAGPFSITLRAQDATGLFDTGLFVFEVASGNELTISIFGLPDGQVGVDYAQKLMVTRGMEPYTWSLVEGAGVLPEGLMLSADGTISGVPGADGVFAFVVQVRDAQLRLDTQPLSIRVAPAEIDLMKEGGCGCTASRQRSSTGSLALLMLLGFSNFFFRARKRFS